MPLVDEIAELIERLEAAPVAEVDWELVACTAVRLVELADRRKSEAAVRATIAAAIARVLELHEEIEYIGLDVTALATAPSGATSLTALVELRGVLEEVGAHSRNRPSSLQALRAMERDLEQLARRANAALAVALQPSALDLPAVVISAQRDAVAEPAPDRESTTVRAERDVLAHIVAPAFAEASEGAAELVQAVDAPPEHAPEPRRVEHPHGVTAEQPAKEPGTAEVAVRDGEDATPRREEEPPAGAEASDVSPEDRWYNAGIEKFAAGDLPAANVLLTAAVRRPALPALAVLEHVTFAPQPMDVPRPPTGALETAVAEIQRVAEEWTEIDALLACTMTTTLCVVDGLQDAGAPECLQRSREAIRSCPMWLEPFLGYWDATHRPIVALRSFVVDEQTARAAYDLARRELQQRIDACRGMHFTFAAGNRFAGYVFPDRGGPFGWVDDAIGDGSADAGVRLAVNADELASLDIDRFIDAQCRELGQPPIVAAARNNIGSKLEVLREAVQGWRLAAEGLRNVGTQSAAFFAKQFRELRREIAAIEPPPEDCDAESRIVHRCARSMLSRARFVIEGRG
jgi:hypothetical protein